MTPEDRELIRSVRYGDLDEVITAIAAGGDVNVRSEDVLGNHSLHYALWLPTFL